MKLGLVKPGMYKTRLSTHEDCELDRGLITKLATCAYIHNIHHVVLKGATNIGKSYIENVFGVAVC